jgi:protein TonB
VPQGRPDLAIHFAPAAAADRARGRPSTATDVLVLTDSEEFQLAIQQALTVQQRVWRVPTADQAADLLVAGRVGVLVIDTECVPHAAPAMITQLSLEFPDLVVVVAGTHDEVSQFAHLVGEGLVYRFLQKPVSTARVRAFIDAAVRRHMELLATAPAAVVARKRRLRSWPRTLGVTLAALIAIGAIYARFRPHGAELETAAPGLPPAIAPPALTDSRVTGKEPPPAEAVSGTKRTEIEADRHAVDRVATPTLPTSDAAAMPSAVAAPSEQVSQLLRAARAALAAGNLVDPDSSSAKTLVAAALQLDPQNPEARRALRQLRNQIVAQAQNALTNSDWAASARWIGQAQELGVADSELAPLRRAQADGEQRMRTDRLAGLARKAAQRISDDMLIEPAGDNAREYLNALQTEDAALAAPLRQQFAERLLAKARRQLSEHDYDAAERWLKEADSTGVLASEVNAARAELQAAREQAAFVASVVPSGRLKLTKYVPPAYPSKALTAQIEGSVDLEFTIDASGSVRDISVTRSVPTGMFEKAAVDALARWRYQPVQRDGQPTDQRASVRVQFQMER